LWELARLKTDRLLEEEVEDGSQAVQIIGMDPDVDRQGLAAQQAPVDLRRGPSRRSAPLETRPQPLLRLLEEEVEDGSQAVQIIGMDPDVDRQGLAAQLAKIKVALGRCVIQDGVQPQIQATREGLADGARRDRR